MKASSWHLEPRRSGLEPDVEVGGVAHIEDVENTSSFVAQRMTRLASDGLPTLGGSYFPADNLTASVYWKAEMLKGHDHSVSPFVLL